MALSGNFHHYVSGEFGLYCEWTGSQSASGNYTDVTLNVYLRHYNLDVGARTDNTVTINGTSQTFASERVYRMGASSYTNKLLTTQTVRVTHNANGTKTGVALSARYHFNGTYAGQSVTWIEASTTVDLNPITVYSLSKSSGTGSSITVNRTSSGYGATGNLAHGATLYSGDKLTISFSNSSGYVLTTHTVNGSTFTSGGSHTVSGNVSVVSNALAKYTLTISAGSGSSITVNRTSSGYGATGNLSNNAAIYAGDKLKITFTPNSGYAISTHTVNGSAFTSGNTHTVAGNVAVAATAYALSSTVGATDANIGSTSTITVTKGNSSYYHSLQYSFGASSPVTGYITSSGGTSSSEQKFTATSVAFTVPTSFYAKIPSAKSGTCTITCRTYSSASGSLVGSAQTCTFTATASSSTCTPTVNGTVVDTNTKTTALTGSNAKLVRYKSTAKCTITAVAKHSASISTKTVNGQTLTSTYSFENVDVSTFTFSTTDSRGYSASKTVSPTIVPYVQLTSNPQIKRTTPTGTEIQLNASGAMYVGSFGSQSNSVVIRYRYKKTSASSYGNWVLLPANAVTYGANSYSTGWVVLSGSFDYQYAYDFQVEVYDGSTDRTTNANALSDVVVHLVVKQGLPVFDWGEHDFNINGTLQAASYKGPVNIAGDLYASGSVTGQVVGLGGVISTIPSTGDLNDYVSPGVYAVSGNSTAQALVQSGHCPSSFAGRLTVISAVGSSATATSNYVYLRQTYETYRGNVYQRWGDSSTGIANLAWHEWVLIIAQQAYETGTISYSTTYASGHDLTVRKYLMLGMCYVEGTFTVDKAVSAGTAVTIATLPTGYRPTRTVPLAVSMGSGVGAVHLTSGGAVRFLRTTAVSSGDSISVRVAGWFML